MKPTSSDTAMSDRDFAALRAIVHKNTGITIGETRKSMLVSRLRKRLREKLRGEIAQLVDDPRDVDAELGDLFEALG